MAKIVPFHRKGANGVERTRPLRYEATDMAASTLGLSEVSASLRSASDDGKAILQQLERYRKSLSMSYEFHERCMAATELPSLAEMVRAREELIKALPEKSATE